MDHDRPPREHRQHEAEREEPEGRRPYRLSQAQAGGLGRRFRRLLGIRRRTRSLIPIRQQADVLGPASEDEEQQRDQGDPYRDTEDQVAGAPTELAIQNAGHGSQCNAAHASSHQGDSDRQAPAALEPLGERGADGDE